MNTITIEPSSKADYQLFIGLAKRLNAKISVNSDTFTETNQEKINKQKEAQFFALSGSFDLPESSDELIKIIEESRTSNDMDTSWT
jgi:hypothetical protein